MRINRREKIARLLQRELSQVILYELTDPKLGFITVTMVEPDIDLKTAKVFVSIIGSESAQGNSLECLIKAKKYIHRLLMPRLKMKYIPDLTFHIDKNIDKLTDISEIDILAQHAEILASKKKNNPGASCRDKSL